MERLSKDVQADLQRLVTLIWSDECRSIVCGSCASSYADDPLAAFLYSRWYCAPAEPFAAVPMLGRRDLTQALRAAVTSLSCFEPGWVVSQSAQDGTCVAAKLGQSRQFRPGEYSNLSRLGLPVVPGDALAVCECLQWIDTGTGFWYLQSAAGGPDGAMIRIYFNVGQEGVGFVLRELTEALDALKLRYSLKCPFLAAAYTRVDAVILYAQRDGWPTLQPVVEALAVQLQPYLRCDHPPLTLGLAPGVAFAENPDGGVSFGESRCRALAPVVRAVIEQPVVCKDEACGRLVEGLIAAGIDPQQPWFNGKPHD